MPLDPANRSAMEYNDGIHQYLKDVCAPIFKKYGLTLFEYIRVFFDNTCLNISTNQEWLVHNYTQCPMGTLLQKHLERIPVGSTRYIPYGYSERELSNPMLKEAYDFDIWNGLYVYKRYEHECECYVFATDRSNVGIMEFYMNERVLIEKFIHFFKEKAKPFIDSFDESKRTILTETIEPESLPKPPIQSNDDIAPLIEPSKFSFYKGEQLISLSKRETQCLCLISYGKTAKEISRVLGVSPRTVESYLSTVRKKIGSNFKADLLDLFHGNVGANENMQIFI